MTCKTVVHVTAHLLCFNLSSIRSYATVHTSANTRAPFSLSCRAAPHTATDVQPPQFVIREPLFPVSCSVVHTAALTWHNSLFYFPASFSFLFIALQLALLRGKIRKNTGRVIFGPQAPGEVRLPQPIYLDLR